MRRTVIILALALGATLGVPSAAAAPPVGGCPTPEWELRASPTPDIKGNASVDRNRDGLSCYLEAPEGGGIFTIIDYLVTPR